MKNKKDIIRVIALCIVILMLLVIPLMMIGCDANTAATNDEDREAKYAIISMPNGELVEAEVEGWYFWDNGMVRIITDDATYVTHGANVTMITK